MHKVLHIIQGYGGGISSVVKNLILSADPERLQQDVMSFTFDHGEAFLQEMESRGAKTFLMPRPRKQGLGPFCRYIRDVLRRGQYDVVHCHSDGWRAALFRRLAKSEKVPLFCIHAHRASDLPGSLACNPLYAYINRWISRRCADIRFTCGKEAAQYIYGTSEGAVTIPNGVDPRRCREAAATDREALREELEIPPQTRIYLQVGRLVAQKNYGFTMELAQHLKKEGLDYRLLIIGAGPLEQEIREEIRRRELDSHVCLLGRRNDVYRLMAGADAMLLPSLWEGLPTVVVEAQAMGLHSLASLQVTRECDMDLGLVQFLPTEDPAAWETALRQLCKHAKPEQTLCLEKLRQQAYTAASSVERYTRTLEQYLEN